jgi:hypothetical protein
MSDEARIEAGAHALAEQFMRVGTRREYFVVIDGCYKQVDWLRKHRRDLYSRELEPALKAAWARTDAEVMQQQRLAV